MSRGDAASNFGVGSWIERRARFAPDRVALIVPDGSFTYAELAGRIRRLANGLRRLGVRPGDRVAWVGPNHPAFLESLFATALLGAVMAPVNHRLDAEQGLAVLEDIDPTVLIRHRADQMPVPSSVRHRMDVGGAPDSTVPYEGVMARSPDDEIHETVGMDDPCMLPHTSGTTGGPKGVILTHGNVTWNVVNFLSCADFRSDDVTVAIAPFFRVGGTGVNVLPVLFVGGTVVVPIDPNADDILDLIGRHQVTVGFGNPDILHALARSERWPDSDLSSLRFVVTGGAPVPERLIRAYLERGVTLLQGYGLSEAGPLALLLDPQAALQKVGAAGRPPLMVDIRIEGLSGQTAASGETGELLVRGPNVMAGYWNRPEATREVLSRDGWLRTGDAARMDEEGFIWIVDRVKDAFASDGHRVYPGDVERVLARHPAVDDVGVVGVPDPSGGEAGAAFVMLVAGAQVTERDLLAFCEEQLAPHQVPASLTFVNGLPRNSVGKVIRSQLRALASASRETGA